MVYIKKELSSLNIDKLEKKYGVSVNYTQTKLKWWTKLKSIKILRF